MTRTHRHLLYIRFHNKGLEVDGVVNVQVRRALKAILFLMVFVVVSACDRAAPIEEGVKGVNAVLVLREKAIESKDLELYKSLVFEGYAESGFSYDDVIGDITHLFATPGAIDYQYQKARPSISMNSARVVHMVEYTFEETGESKKIHETLYLRKVNGKWLMSGGVTLGVAR